MRQRPEMKFCGLAFVAVRRIAMSPVSELRPMVYAEPEEVCEVDCDG